MDHPVRVVYPNRSTRYITKRLKSRQFENEQLENLYQRYLYTVQRLAVLQFLAVFASLTAVLSVLTISFCSTNEKITVRFVYYLVQCLTFIILLSTLTFYRSKKSTVLSYVTYIVYICLIIFVTISLPLNFNFVQIEPNYTFSCADGIWELCLITFSLHTMLPSSTIFCLVFATIGAGCHLIVCAISSNHLHREFLTEQVRKEKE